MEDHWLKNKCLVIIGGTTGIGLSAAQAFTRHGANLVAIGRSPESVEKASSILKNGIVTSGDATEPETAFKAIETCLKHFGGFDGIYHVAGGSGRKFGDGPLHELTKEGWDHTLSLNLTSLMLSNQAAVYFMSDYSKFTTGQILSVDGGWSIAEGQY